MPTWMEQIQLISLIMGKINVQFVKQWLENKWAECQSNKCIPVVVNYQDIEWYLKM